jgi:hypothetical protein
MGIDNGSSRMGSNLPFSCPNVSEISTPRGYLTPSNSSDSGEDSFQRQKKRKYSDLKEESYSPPQPYKKSRFLPTPEDSNSSSGGDNSSDEKTFPKNKPEVPKSDRAALNDKLNRKLAKLRQQQKVKKPGAYSTYVLAQKLAKEEDERLKKGSKLQVALNEAKRSTPHDPFTSTQNPTAKSVLKSIQFNREAQAHDLTTTVHAIARTMQDESGQEAARISRKSLK